MSFEDGIDGLQARVAAALASQCGAERLDLFGHQDRADEAES
jgi:hypothetical protein